MSYKKILEGVFVKYKHIKIAFLIALILGLAVRFIQLFSVTESSTGFFFVGKEIAGFVYSALMFIVLIAFSTCAALVYRCPLKTPKVSKPLGAMAMVSGAFILIEAITYITQVSLFNWEKLLLGITGPATAIFFIFYGLKGFIKSRLARPLYAIPILYFLSRLVCEFISVSKTSLILQNVLNIAAIAAVLVFVLEWGKIANNISSEVSYKTILISGGVAALLCAFASIPELVFLSVKQDATAHQNPVSLVNLLVMCLFIVFYIYRHFKGANFQKKSRNKNPKIDNESLKTIFFTIENVE